MNLLPLYGYRAQQGSCMYKTLCLQTGCWVKKKQCELTSHLSTVACNTAKSKASLMSKKQLPVLLDSIMHYTADIGAATDV